MYPLAENMFAPRNQWYLAAWSSEISRKPMERWILDNPLVFYRKENGEVAAIDGRCPHRHYPLSAGEVVGDNLRCGYHGLTFSPNGECVSIPSQPTIPNACHINSYRAVERWKWIWVWPGDQALCDESLIPDHEQMDLDKPEFNIEPKGYFLLKSRYMLMHDNLLDLTHLAYLHSTTIGDREIAEANLERSQTEWTQSCKSIVSAVDPQPYFKKLMGWNASVDRRWGSTFYAPSLHFIHEDFYAPGQSPEQGHSSLMRGRIFHAVTPATKDTSHYFFASGRDKSTGEDLETLIRAVTPVLDEDIFAVEEIERMIKTSEKELKDVLLRADANCVAGRRLMERMIMADSTPRIIAADRASL
ncbi:Toluene-4-sulfonate monooxygenase system iron-sulfur subunit TsaM1 [Pseudomonas sp. 37 R 15]|uniref:aromatic ring-hydroxylating dioxygenase subunit alpha n=1 Tax=Pseudomonas sp. 37 R 15 TaxID=1844104 RepID=UPI0008126B28|nr:aromatic ring-hydroxylating dioxygenase subunit alpha [Pseudomonas sp. 37 R 15]CRM38089.1 Toluene-4-sulfonate monooxygenase system iron-sulfur subunit TsaM1 [Pseudomonas sp. 37 R 15]